MLLYSTSLESGFSRSFISNGLARKLLILISMGFLRFLSWLRQSGCFLVSTLLRLLPHCGSLPHHVGQSPAGPDSFRPVSTGRVPSPGPDPAISTVPDLRPARYFASAAQGKADPRCPAEGFVSKKMSTRSEVVIFLCPSRGKNSKSFL